MPTPTRVKPWLTLSVAQGNAVQVGGLLGAVALAWFAGREGPGGAAYSQHSLCSRVSSVTAATV